MSILWSGSHRDSCMCDSDFSSEGKVDALIEDLLDAASRLRGSIASNVETTVANDEICTAAGTVERVAQTLRGLVPQLVRDESGFGREPPRAYLPRSRPTHFVGCRMPPFVRTRLRLLQSLLMRRWPLLRPAAVNIHKVHVTLFVTIVEQERQDCAAAAMQDGIAAWTMDIRSTCASAAGMVRLYLRGLHHFERNGVLYVKLLPDLPLQMLRKRLVEAFSDRGFQIAAQRSPYSLFQPHVTLFKASQAGRGYAGNHRMQEEQAAKQLIFSVARSMPALKEHIHMGTFSIVACELADIRRTQADGYYEVQGFAGLCAGLGRSRTWSEACIDLGANEAPPHFERHLSELLQALGSGGTCSYYESKTVFAYEQPKEGARCHFPERSSCPSGSYGHSYYASITSKTS